MSSDKKIDESKFFTPRGTIETTYIVHKEEFPITVHVPNNFEHDKMMDEFTKVDDEEERMKIQSPELIEERILRFLKKAPFTCKGVEWNKASEKAKRLALRELNPEHRTAINRIIIGKAQISKEEQDFLHRE